MQSSCYRKHLLGVREELLEGLEGLEDEMKSSLDWTW